MTENKIRKWMRRELSESVDEYLDSSNCLCATKLGENAYNHFYPDNEGEDIPDVFWDVSAQEVEKMTIDCGYNY